MNTKPLLLFLGHGYHKKTGSSFFFIKELEKYYNVTLRWIDLHLNTELSIEKDPIYYSVAFFWQILPEERYLSNIRCDKIYCAPMYDSLGVYQYGEIFDQKIPSDRKINYLSFSKSLHNFLTKKNLNSFFIQYYPDITGQQKKQISAKPKVVFVYRRKEISWETVKKILNPTQVSGVHIHIATDPNHQFVRPTAEDINKYNITFSEWLENKNDYIELMERADIFIAPRLYEGIGMAFLDAVQRGLCIVAPNKPTANEYFEDKITGYLYDPDHPKYIDISSWQEVSKNCLLNFKKGYNHYIKRLSLLFLDMKHKRNIRHNFHSDIRRYYFSGNASYYQKKVLLIFPHNPFLNSNGVQSRFLALLEYFSSRRIQVHLLAHSNFVDHWEIDYTLFSSKLSSLILDDFQISKLSGKITKPVSQLPDFAFSSLEIFINEIIKKEAFDYLAVGYVHWANLIKRIQHKNKVLFVEDCISVNEKQRLGESVNYNLERSLQDEASRIDLFDKTIFISNDELKAFRPRCKHSKFYYIPHIIDSHPSEPNKEILYDILFVGSDNPFNADGLKWFAANVAQKLPVHFRIGIAGGVCNKIDKEIFRGHPKNIYFLGVVPDLKDIYKSSRLSICPLLGGTGLKIKVVEALAYGLPVVSLPAGLIGLPEWELACVRVNDGHEFAAALINLISDKKKLKSLSENAKKLVDKNFSRSRIFNNLDMIFEG